MLCLHYFEYPQNERCKVCINLFLRSMSIDGFDNFKQKPHRTLFPRTQLSLACTVNSVYAFFIFFSSFWLQLEQFPQDKRGQKLQWLIVQRWHYHGSIVHMQNFFLFFFCYSSGMKTSLHLCWMLNTIHNSGAGLLFKAALVLWRQIFLRKCHKRCTHLSFSVTACSMDRFSFLQRLQLHVSVFSLEVLSCAPSLSPWLHPSMTTLFLCQPSPAPQAHSLPLQAAPCRYWRQFHTGRPLAQKVDSSQHHGIQMRTLPRHGLQRKRKG